MEKTYWRCAWISGVVLTALLSKAEWTTAHSDRIELDTRSRMDMAVSIDSAHFDTRSYSIVRSSACEVDTRKRKGTLVFFK